jgi:hypothetical protein
MIGSWRVPLIVTSHFPMYQSTFWSKKLNDKKKLTGRPSPTVRQRQDVLFIMQRHQFHASNQWPIVGFVYEKTIMNLHGRWL